jgi:hypothetical protein
VIERIDEALGRWTDLRALDWLRIVVGPIVIVHLWPFVEAARDGRIYRDSFFEPYATWYPELPRGLYVALLCIGVLAGLAMMLRIAPRIATAVAFAVVAYNLFLSTTHFHNNRFYVFVVLGVLAMAPVGAGPAWPLLLLRAEVVTVYGGSGLSKLLDPDWWGGTVTWGRVVKVEDRLPTWLPSVLFDRDFHTYAGKVIVLTELFIALGLVWKRTRVAAVVVAVVFHLAIGLTADVEVFSILGIAALVIWFEPAELIRRWRGETAATAHP